MRSPRRGVHRYAAGTNLWSITILGSVVSIIPLIIAFLSLERFWRGGPTVGALKQPVRIPDIE